MKEFKLIIAGGRDFTDSKKMHVATDLLVNHGELKEYAVSSVTGMARGADMLGREFALAFNVKRYEFPADWNQYGKRYEFPADWNQYGKRYEFPADWNQYGKRAGFIRNKQMGDFADGLLAFQCREQPTPGTAHMIKYMQSLGKPVRIIYY